MVRVGFILVILLLSLTGCSVYKEYSFESYEKTKPEGRIEFTMKNNSVSSFTSKQLEMIKSTKETYVVYLKDGNRMEFKKDEVKSVRMSDMKKFRTLLYITSGILVALTIGFVLALMGGFSS